MKRIVIVGMVWGAYLASASASWADPPRVVKTTPANGAMNVPVDMGQMVIVFDRNMKMNSWSLLETEDHPFPPPIPDEEPWRDPLTFVLRVEKLQPNTTYAVQLNSERRQGFQAAADQTPLPVTVLTFTTGAEGGEGRLGGEASGRLAFISHWREGETQERILTLERRFEFIEADGSTSEFQEKAVVTSALQVVSAPDGNYRHVKGQMLKLEVTQTNPETGRMEPLDTPVLGSVLEAEFRDGQWQARSLGEPAPPEELQRFADALAIDGPFAPPGPVAVGEGWELSGKPLQIASRVLGPVEDFQGTVACRFAGRGGIQGHPSAKISHSWKGRFRLYDLFSVEAAGQGETTYLLDAHKFISTTVELDLTVPEQKLPEGQILRGTGRQKVTQRLRYFPKGEYAELKPVTGPGTPEGGPLEGTGIVGSWLFRNEEMEVTFEARADGRFRQTFRSGQEKEENAGTYRFADGILELHPEGGETLRFNCRLVGPDQLEVTDEEGNGYRLVRQGAPPSPQQPPPQSSPPPAGGGKGVKNLVFQRISEPREQAFTMLVPQGWIVEGGIFHVDPTQAGGPRQSIESKVDFTVKRDEAGTVLLRKWPDWYYCDSRHMPAGQMGLFPPGSKYAGMPVVSVMSASQFITQVVLPQAHPQAQGVQVIEEKSLPDLARAYQQRAASLIIPLQANIDAAMLTVTYTEGGVRYQEKIVALIEDKGALMVGEWGNRETLLLRAPADEFAQWEPIFLLMTSSVRLNSQWLQKEIRAQIKAGDKVIETQKYIQEIDRQIVEHRQKTNAEINNDMFLTLTGQEEYVNPYTHEVEVGTSQLGRYRWETESGDVVYSDEENFNPNILPDGSVLNRTDWKRSEIRPRFPQ